MFSAAHLWIGGVKAVIKPRARGNEAMCLEEGMPERETAEDVNICSKV